MSIATPTVLTFKMAKQADSSSCFSMNTNTSTTEPMSQIDYSEDDVEGEGDFNSEVEEPEVDLDAPDNVNHSMEPVEPVEGPVVPAVHTWPSCWDKKMWQSKKRDYPWLVSNNEKLGCSVCNEVSNLGCYSGKSIHISKEWQSTSVMATGVNKEKQLMSLRNKIKRHKESVGHVQAERIMQNASKQTLENNVLRMNEKQFASTKKLFRIAYKIGKLGHPFSDMPTECDVSILNGVDIGTTLQSDKSCRAILNHIGHEMQFKICKIVIDSDTKMSIIIDESTTISKKSALIIYIKVCLPEPTTFFLDIIELDDLGAECIFSTLMECLDMYGFTLHVLSEKLICFASDGASVMLGSQSGVASRIQQVFPNVIIWHCMNHRLELAVGDAIHEVSGTNHFKAFFDKLYCLYHTSSKNRR